MTKMSVEEFMSVVLEMVNRGKKQAREPVTEPATEPVTEPVTNRGKKRAREPVTEPAMEPVTEPVTNRGKKRAREPVTEPVTNRGKKPATEPSTEPVTEPVTKGEMLKMERDMQEMVKREKEEMKRDMQEIAKREKEEMKRDMQAIVKRELEEMLKRFFQTASTQGAPADLHESPRFCGRTPLDSLTGKSEEVESPTYELEFVNKLHNTIFTKDKIKDENGRFVEIKLIETSTRKIVEDGSLSSMEIKIHVLAGDFGSKANEEWTEKEFKEKIVVANARGKLVKVEPNITLRKGVGTMDNFIFLDNSSWIPSKKFRLGARVLRRPSNMSEVIRIKEAITEPFAVRDHRGKSNHLKKIVKDGIILHEALIRDNIRTISDLKQIYKTNRDKLKEILGRCSDSEWAAIAQFAVDDANSNPSPPSQVAEAYNPATTVLAGLMQTEYNRASSSHHHSEFQENFQHLASPGRPLSTIGDNSLENYIFSNQNNNAPMNSVWAANMPMFSYDNTADFPSERSING